MYHTIYKHHYTIIEECNRCTQEEKRWPAFLKKNNSNSCPKIWTNIDFPRVSWLVLNTLQKKARET